MCLTWEQTRAIKDIFNEAGHRPDNDTAHLPVGDNIFLAPSQIAIEVNDETNIGRRIIGEIERLSDETGMPPEDIARARAYAPDAHPW